MRLKIRKHRRLVSWLLVLMLALNMFSPLNNVWAEGLGTSGEDVINVNTGTPSNADRDPVVNDHEKTDDPTGTPSNADRDPTDSGKGGTSGAPKATPSSVSLLPVAFSSEDKTSALMELKKTIKQNGKIINEGETLTSTDTISVEVSFRVPVDGDDFSGITPAPTTVQLGDTAIFELSNAFKLVSGTNIDLRSENNTLVGHVTFFTDSGTMYAQVDFDGNPDVFNEVFNNVRCKFSATLKYDSSGSAGSEGDHLITILDKTYTVTVPPVETIYNVSKSGAVDLTSKSIEWTVNISAAKSGEGIDLEGYKFSDDLTSVGEYIPGSFMVDNTGVTPAENGKVISYTFPAGSTSPKKVTFKTEIPDASYYSSSRQTIGNKAQLLDKEDTLKKEGQFTVSWTPKWIEKSGESSDKGSTGIYDPTNRTITWSITANHNGAKLDNAVITDVLPSGLQFLSAKWQTWNGTVWVNDVNLPDPGASGEYVIGDINSQIKLTIVTKVLDTNLTTGVTTFTNSANIKWDGLTGPGYGSGNVGVGIGYNAIKKEGTANPSTGEVTWKVTVDPREQIIPDPKVYDLLVYGNSSSGFDLSSATGIPAGITPGDLTARYGQKYIENSFSGSGLTLTVHQIDQGGVPVADLLEITGFLTGAGSGASTFTFKSQVLDPEIFATNQSSTVYNTASLFSSNAKLNEATATPGYQSKMLSKEMLKREAMADPAAGVNNRTTNASEGFDYQDKSVIFRLSVNANGMDLTNMVNAAGEIMGTATVTDTLPTGWVFDKIDGSDYLIFEGTNYPDGSGSVQAAGSAPVTVTGLTSSFSGGTATFTFNPLDKPYVILVKARPTSETAAGYFDTNKATNVTNNLSLKTDKSPEVPSSQKVTINSQILEKSNTLPKAGELKWTVYYKPYNLPQTGSVLKDTLPTGIDLRTNASGALLLTGGNITVNEMTLNADGTYASGDEVTLIPGENISYDNTTRILSFMIPDSKKAYCFSYITDITGEPGSVSNKVSLYGDSTKQEETSKPYSITAADGGASMQRNGYITITKTDGSGVRLPGAEFTLFALDGVTVIKKGITANDGTLKLKVIPDGEYILLETAAPAGYNLEGIKHTLSVTTTGETVITSIDGKSGANANTITVKNFHDNTVGSLTIKKTVDGNGGETNKKFNFTLTLSDISGTYPYIGIGVPNGSIKSGDTISLAHNQSITILELPKDTAYAVTEEDYSSDGYQSFSNGESGTIAADEVKIAEFINTKFLPGSLTIKKTVAGNSGEANKKFNFTVTFKADGTYSYKGNGVPDGTIKSGDTISLADGQSITITGLPKDITYEVIEEDYSNNGFSTASTDSSGIIQTDEEQIASFINTKIMPGSLTISKTVAGSGADTKKKFDFTVTFKAGGTYSYTGKGVSNGTIKSGDKISLADGESITITGLPDGTEYQVTEANYSSERYTTTNTGDTGTIRTLVSSTAAFTNTYRKPTSSGGGGGGGGNPKVPAKPNTPTTPAAPVPADPTVNVDGSTPTGNMEGKTPDELVDINGNIPTGTRYGRNGLPKTGDNISGDMVIYGLLCISALLGMAASANILLRKHTDK
jgi:hypothetical protein